MKTLSSLDLELVTGGTAPRPTATDAISGSSSGSSNDALLSTLTGIQSSLKDLGKNGNGGLFGGNNGLLFMTMALAMSQRQNTVVVNGGGGYGGGGHGFRFRVW